LREESRLRVVEIRVLRRICGPKRDEVKREWRKLHNEGLNDLYSSPNSDKFENEMGGECSAYGGKGRRILAYHHTYRCDDTRGCVMQF